MRYTVKRDSGRILLRRLSGNELSGRSSRKFVYVVKDESKGDSKRELEEKKLLRTV